MQMKATDSFTYQGKAFSAGDMVELPKLVADQLLRTNKVEFIKTDNTPKDWLPNDKVIQRIKAVVDAYIKGEAPPAKDPVVIIEKREDWLYLLPHTREIGKWPMPAQSHKERKTSENIEATKVVDSTSAEIPDGIGEPTTNLILERIKKTIE